MEADVNAGITESILNQEKKIVKLQDIIISHDSREIPQEVTIRDGILVYHIVGLVDSETVLIRNILTDTVTKVRLSDLRSLDSKQPKYPPTKPEITPEEKCLDLLIGYRDQVASMRPHQRLAHLNHLLAALKNSDAPLLQRRLYIAAASILIQYHVPCSIEDRDMINSLFPLDPALDDGDTNS